MIFYFLRHEGEFFTAILPATSLLSFQSPYLVPVVHVNVAVEFVLNRKLKSLTKTNPNPVSSTTFPAQ